MIDEYLVWINYMVRQLQLKYWIDYNSEQKRITRPFLELVKIKSLKELKEEKGFYNYKHYESIYIDDIRIKRY